LSPPAHRACTGLPTKLTRRQWSSTTVLRSAPVFCNTESGCKPPDNHHLVGFSSRRRHQQTQQFQRLSLLARWLHQSVRRVVKMKKVLVLALTMAAALSAKDKDKVRMVEPVHSDAWYSIQNQNKMVKDVRHELIMLPYFGVFDDLGFTVNGGTVTLTGEVTRP